MTDIPMDSKTVDKPTSDEASSETEEFGLTETPPEPQHNKMPLALFLIWVAFICYGVIYMIKFGVPDLIQWLNMNQ